jgi:hypothetical protein
MKNIPKNDINRHTSGPIPDVPVRSEVGGAVVHLLPVRRDEKFNQDKLAQKERKTK